VNRPCISCGVPSFALSKDDREPRCSECWSAHAKMHPVPVCAEIVHEALKRDVYKLHRECLHGGEQRWPGEATSLLLNHWCGGTLGVRAAS
jgi:hypothetical protein